MPELVYGFRIKEIKQLFLFISKYCKVIPYEQRGNYNKF